MILNYGDKRTADFAEGRHVAAFQGFAAQAAKRLTILNNATSTTDLAALNSNRFEALRGDRRGSFSIRINTQWRIVFQWPSDAIGPSEVTIVDYH